MNKLRIWAQFFGAAIAACRTPKACTSCNETTYKTAA